MIFNSTYYRFKDLLTKGVEGLIATIKHLEDLLTKEMMEVQGILFFLSLHLLSFVL